MKSRNAYYTSVEVGYVAILQTWSPEWEYSIHLGLLELCDTLYSYNVLVYRIYIKLT